MRSDKGISGSTADYYHEEARAKWAEARDGHTETALDRVPSGGGEDARWGDDAAIHYIHVGMIVTGPVLTQITRDYSRDVALTVDVLSEPCDCCGLNTYGGGTCEDCEPRHGFAMTAVGLELSGAHSPREK